MKIIELVLISMTKILHKRSEANGTLPSAEELDYGEIAINYSAFDPTIAIKNSLNSITSFKSKQYIDDNDLFTTGKGVKSIVRKNSGNSSAGYYAFAEGYDVTASGSHSHAEGYSTTASGTYSHAEGAGTKNGEYYTIASGNFGSHAEGCRTMASGQFGSHSEGYETKASGEGAHAEGGRTTANGHWSHAEGYGTIVEGNDAHAEGWESQASKEYSHAEGQKSIASGVGSHAEGIATEASGDSSHSEGQATIASGVASHSEGRYNVASTLSIHCVGIGEGKENRKNAEDICRSNGYKYLIGLGDYDGTNLTVTSEGTESINTDIKSVQEIVLDLINRVTALENKV